MRTCILQNVVQHNIKWSARNSSAISLVWIVIYKASSRDSKQNEVFFNYFINLQIECAQ